jgi:hypothetical protein
MVDKTNPNGDTSVGSNLLPAFFRTDTNKKFLQATIDQLVQPGAVTKINGFVGREYAKATKGTDIFLDAASAQRKNYQLEPGIVVNDTLGNTTFFKDYIDYINQISVFSGNTTNHARLNKQEFYSWDPQIDWDKFVNFQHYYWLPYGPETIRIFGQQLGITSSYTVTIESAGADNTYLFTPDGLTPDPVITLYRGQTYTFNINSPSNPFSFKLSRTAGVLDRYIIDGIDKYAIELGTITFEVPLNAPSLIYYQSETDINLGGAIQILDVTDNSYIDVEKDIIGKATYVLPNGTALSNGMKISFGGNVTPNVYAKGEYYVEGVGTAIQLVNKDILEVISTYSTSETILFDSVNYDVDPFSDASGFAQALDYITINRASTDHNPWSRYNRWFHADTISASSAFNGNVPSLDQAVRATRPIIEFKSNLKLFNFGTYAAPDVDLIDTFTTDVFSTIEGAVGYNIDGVQLSQGQLVLFTADPDPFVTGKIYRVTFIDLLDTADQRSVKVTGASGNGATATLTLSTGIGRVGETIVVGGVNPVGYNGTFKITAVTGNTVSYINTTTAAYKSGGTVTGGTTTRQIHLEEVATPLLNQTVLVKQGNKNLGVMYWYNGTKWIKTQQKSNINQPPLFDIVDATGISFGNTDSYPGSTFLGTPIFSYKLGSGTIDSPLGFPLSYKNIANIGDIVFNFNLATDSFQYKETAALISKNINLGFLLSYNQQGTVASYCNGWQTCISTTTQAAVRIYKNSNKTNNFEIDIFDNINNLKDLVVKVYVNGTRLSPYTWNIKAGIVYNIIVLDTAISADDVLTIKAYAAQPINSNGFYEVPLNLQNNPLNELITDFTLGEVIDHVNSIVDNLGKTFVGSFPGTGNLRNLGNITQYGTKFVQHSGPASLSLYHITSETKNIVRAIEQSRDDYNRFKRNFINTVNKLGLDTDPIALVDLALAELNKDKPKTFPYYFSDMVPYGASTMTNLNVVDYRVKTYPLTSVFTLDALSNKAVGVYLNKTQLLYGKDYTFNVQGFIVIDASVTMNNGDIITTYEYDNTDGSFVPETPTKLGIWPKYEPKLYLDTTLVSPVIMIQGHDGSQVAAYGDYRDYVILELEKRIFNNIKVSYNPDIFDISTIIPSYNRTNDYSLTEFNQALAPSFYKWTTIVDRDFTKPLSFDRNNSFTFNYTGHSAPDGTTVPGYWRGIYRHLLDTDRPNLCPWEMLGFTLQPSWWVKEYGPAPYTADNIPMWTDISNGLVRGDEASPSYINSKFAKPFLLKHLPVDANGDLVSPLVSGLAQGTITAESGGSFVFGDVSPVEAAWRRSSYYPFSVILTSMLLTPAKTFGLLLDRSRIIRDVTGQIVYKDTGLRIKPMDVLLPSIASSTTRVQTAGVINYIVNYIASEIQVYYSDYQYDLQQMTARISYRVGGFTSKQKFNLLLDSKTPLSTGNIFVPQENFNITLNSSSPLRKITYSGIIISNLSTGFEVKGYSRTQPYFKYYPYTSAGASINVGGISESHTDWTSGQQYGAGTIVKYKNSYYRVKSTHIATSPFNPVYYTALPNLPMIGGVDALIRRSWDRTQPITIPYGYSFSNVQEVVDFILGYGEWLKDQGFIFDDFNSGLNSVANWETSTKEFMFWTTQRWNGNQDVWEDWLPNTAIAYNSIVRYDGDYYQAKRPVAPSPNFNPQYFEKLDGLSTVGSSVISLSPSANKITFSTTLSVVDDITNPFNEYEIVKVDGTPLERAFLNSYRQDNAVSYTSRTTDGIYGASFYLLQKEQVVILDNTTMFNDTIYNPATGYKQDRIKVSGYVSTDWYGGFDVPGFIFDQAKIATWEPWNDYALGDIVKYQSYYYSANKFLPGAEKFVASDWIKLSTTPTAKLLPNWTYKASQFTDFYSLDSDNFDGGQQQVAQHLIGYQKRQYLDNIIQDDVSEYKFYQGMIREKGTQNVLNKLFDVLSADNRESINFYEEWAIRVGQYGASGAFENIEFILDEAQFKNNPQGFELLNSVNSTVYDFIIRQTPNDVYVKPVGYTSTPWPELKTFNPFLRSAGYVRSSEVFATLPSIDKITTLDITTLTNGSYIWCTFEGASWNVYRYTDVNLKVTNVTYDAANNILNIICKDLITFKSGTYVGISQVTAFSGFYKVTEVSLNGFRVSATISGFPSPFVQQDSITIYALLSQRTSSIDNIDSILPAKLKPAELLWTDDSGNGSWATWLYSQVYSQSEMPNSAPQNLLGFGRSVAIPLSGSIIATSTNTGIVITYDKASPNSPWIQRQTIQTPFIEPHGLNSPTSMATVLAFSSDGTWMATGSPLVSNAYTKLSTHNGGVYDQNYIYHLGDIVSVVLPDTTVAYYQGVAATILPGIGPISSNSISANPLYWEFIPYLPVNSAGQGSGLTNQGVVSLYSKDTNNIYSLVDTIVSPTIGVTNEQFGSSLAFDNNKLYIGAPNPASTGKVYVLDFATRVYWESVYNPVGSSGTTIAVTSTTGIQPGMMIQGTGFTSGQLVTSIINTHQFTISGIPDSTPSGTLTFVLENWGYNLLETKTGLRTGGLFGSRLSLSSDGSLLAVSETAGTLVGRVTVYSSTGSQTITGTTDAFGQSIALSSDGTYLVISDILGTELITYQGFVRIYKQGSNGLYDTVNTQELVNHYPQSSGYFGNTLSFMGDDTLVVYSSNETTTVGMTFDNQMTTFDKDSTAFITTHNGSGRVDVYDRYANTWVYSETLSTTNVATDNYGRGFAVGKDQIFIGAPLALTNANIVPATALVIGNTYEIRSLGTTDFTLVGATNNVIGAVFTATSVGVGSGTAIGKILSGKLYNYSKPAGAKSWNIIHQQSNIADVSKVKKAFLYNKSTNSLVTYLDVIDPQQGKIPGLAEAEIKYKAFYDPAVYSVGSSSVTVDASAAWSSAAVGQLWWDLRTAKFVNSYDTDIIYRNSTWSTLATGASIDIYEWVSSTLKPSQWDAQADTTAGLASNISGTSLYGDAVYSTTQKYDTVSQTFKTTYYYWVKNKALIPSIPGRNMSAVDVSNLISNPRGENYKYLALTGLNSFSLVNVKSDLSNKDVVLSIEYWLVDKTDQNVHSQWKIISNSQYTTIPLPIEQKWVDSLCGKDSVGRSVPDTTLPIKLRYGVENRPRQGMFVNRFEALKQVIEQTNLVLKSNQIVESRNLTDLHLADTPPSTISGLYDTTIDTYEELQYANVGSFKRPSLSAQIIDGRIVGITINTKGQGFLIAPYITINGDGQGAVLRAIINSSGQITGATIVSPGYGYTSSTTCSVRDYSILVLSDSQSNNAWGIYSYDPTYQLWSRTLIKSYDVTQYWSKIDWYASGYSQFSSADWSMQTFADLETTSETIKIGQLVKIVTANTGGWQLLLKYANSLSSGWTQSYRVVGIENGTIQFSSSLYEPNNSGTGYDASIYDGVFFDNSASTELRIILSVIKNNILVDELKADYINLFFTSVRYSLSEQTYLDWIFKTSFVRAQHNLGNLGQPVTYQPDNLNDFQDYISEVKPYRTKVREYVSDYEILDYSYQAASDFDLPPANELVYSVAKPTALNPYVRHGNIICDDTNINSYPWKNWLDNVGFEVIDIIIVDGGSGYITEPVVTVVSDSGSGATARALFTNGAVNRIILLTRGSGYLSAPKIIITGGLSSTGTAARAVTIIGNSVIRSNLVNIKFDRVTQTYVIAQLQETETFKGQSSKVQFSLKWAPDVRIGQSSVTVNGVSVLRDLYTLTVSRSTLKGYTTYSGKITFTTAPAAGSTIVVTYIKDWSILNASDRIQFYYDPTTGALGKDLSQLMTGVDYGGVIVNGLGFDVGSGWGSVPFYTDKWDSFDASFTDYSVVVSANVHSFTLPYIPASGVQLNVYYIATSVQSYTSNGITLGYDFNFLISNPQVTVINQVTSTSATSTANVAGGVIINVTSTAKLKVGDIVTCGTHPNLLGYNVTVTQIISSTSLKISQILYLPITTGTVITFTRLLVAPTDVLIFPNGTITLTSPISSGSTINITGTLPPKRLDDPYYGIHSGSHVQTNVNAIMVTPVGDGVTTTFTIPNTFTVNSGDEFIWRQSTSDGSASPLDNDYDTALTGGNLAYSTATGLAADDILVDGDGFVTPTSSPATEEVVPGQVVDTVAIKVYDQPSSGSANIRIDNYFSDGATTTYAISQQPNSPSAVIVKVGNTILSGTSDYTVDYVNRKLTFTTAPANNKIVSIYSLGFNGQNILDIDYFVGDGTTLEFLTKAPWLDTTTSLVYVNGVATTVELFKTDFTYTSPNRIGIRFTSAPKNKTLINYIIVSGNQQTFAITKTEKIATNGSLSYKLLNPIGSSLPNESNMIVRVDQNILSGPVNSYFVLANGNLSYTIDPTRFVPYSVAIGNISVLVNGILLTLGTDYTVDPSGITININQLIYAKNQGKQLVIVVNSTESYSFNPSTNVITFTNAYDNTYVVEVTASYKHDVLDIQRTAINISSQISVVPGTVEYYYYKGITSGNIQLDRSVINDNYVWIISNSTLLVPGIDYKLNDNRISVTLATAPHLNDLITVITFGSNVLGSGIAYMQFKDMLNRVIFKRLSANKRTTLVNDLNYNDTSITVADASNFDRPNPASNRPGVVEIRGERIEYFSISGNVLTQLRRGTLGTGVPIKHFAGSFVQDIGPSETIPYTETSIVNQLTSDGTNFVTTSFVPTKASTSWTYDSGFVSSIPSTYGQSNDVEVFVGGYNDSTPWAANTIFSAGTILTVGSYTYRVTAYHQSGASFKSAVTTLNVDGSVLATGVAVSSVLTFFVGNIRLKKKPYKVHNYNQAPDSPEGDLQLDADFAVDGTHQKIRLTTPLAYGTQVTVVKRVGTSWDSSTNILQDTGEIGRFLRATPGIWYENFKQISTSAQATATFDSGATTLDSNNITFDQG